MDLRSTVHDFLFCTTFVVLILSSNLQSKTYRANLVGASAASSGVGRAQYDATQSKSINFNCTMYISNQENVLVLAVRHIER